jgi:hypothetical protein
MTTLQNYQIKIFIQQIEVPKVTKSSQCLILVFFVGEKKN